MRLRGKRVEVLIPSIPPMTCLQSCHKRTFTAVKESKGLVELNTSETDTLKFKRDQNTYSILGPRWLRRKAMAFIVSFILPPRPASEKLKFNFSLLADFPRIVL